MIATVDFTPYQSRATHWGDPSHRARAPNVPTVLPPDAPPAFLRALLLRARFEEASYKLAHLQSEAEYAVWRENSVSVAAWAGRADAAVRVRYGAPVPPLSPSSA